MTEFDEDVQKQRRNLLLISVALMIFDFADVSIAKVGILGTDLLIGKPSVLVATAWLFWLYFLIRYFQYWRMHNARLISSTYHEYLYDWSTSYLAEHYKEQVTKRKLTMRYARFFRFKIVERKANLQAGMDEIPIAMLPLMKAGLVRLRAFWHVAVVSPHFTDQLFPFLVALLAPVVTIATKWSELSRLVA